MQLRADINRLHFHSYKISTVHLGLGTREKEHIVSEKEEQKTPTILFRYLQIYLFVENYWLHVLGLHIIPCRMLIINGCQALWTNESGLEGLGVGCWTFMASEYSVSIWNPRSSGTLPHP